MKMPIFFLKHGKPAWILLYLLTFLQYSISQDALTSIEILVKNVKLSADYKTISYNVYLKDVDPVNPVQVPGFTFRLATPMDILGSSTKKVFVSNGTTELGAYAATMKISGNNWIMKFQSKNVPLKNKDALIVSNQNDGTLIGTFHIQNEDGAPFNIRELKFDYSGSSLTSKTTVAIFKPGTLKLANNSITAQPASNIRVPGSFTFITNQAANVFSLYPNPCTTEFRIQCVDNNPKILNVYDLTGRKQIVREIVGDILIDTSDWPIGIYTIEVNGITTKLIKK